MSRLEIRELEYYVVVAEEAHLGRAAERLGMTQPPLSRAMRALEQKVGTPLLERAGRGIRLTPAGEVLAGEARAVLDASDAARERTRRSAEPRRLVLTMKAESDGGLIAQIVRRWRELPGRTPVEVVVSGVGDQGAQLRTGAADLALLHLPFDGVDGLDTEPLRSEGQVAVMPRDHRLAGRGLLHLADLRDEPRPLWPDEPGEGPRIRDTSQLLQLIELGQAVAVLPEAVIDVLRRDLVAVPVADAETVTMVLAWPERLVSLEVAEFVRLARDVVDEARDAVDEEGPVAPVPIRRRS